MLQRVSADGRMTRQICKPCVDRTEWNRLVLRQGKGKAIENHVVVHPFVVTRECMGTREQCDHSHETESDIEDTCRTP
jgi:hypothetical protein